jgi:hypothetical protein
MAKTSLLSLLAILASLGSFSQNHLEVYLNTQDCLNCNSYLHSLKKISAQENITFFCKPDELESTKAYLIQIGLSQSKVVKHNSSSKSNLSEKSICVLRSYNQQADTIKFDQLPKHIPLIDNMLRDKKSVVKSQIRNYTPTGPRNISYFSSGSLFRWDYLLNKVVQYQRTPNSVTQIEHHVSASLKDTLIEEFQLNRPLYNSVLPVLQSYGKDEMHVYSSFNDSSGTWLALALPFPVIEQTDTIILDYIFLAHKANNKKTRHFFVQGEKNYSYKKHEPDFQNGFWITGDELIVPLFQSFPYEANTHSLLGKAALSSSLTTPYFEPIPFEVPQSYMEDSLEYNYTNAHFDDGIYFMYSYPKFFQVKESKSVDYSNIINSYFNIDVNNHNTFPFFCMDIRELSPSLYEILFAIDANYFLGLIHTDSGNLYLKEKLDYNKKDVGSIRFGDLNEIIWLEKNRKVFHSCKYTY